MYSWNILIMFLTENCSNNYRIDCQTAITTFPVLPPGLQSRLSLPTPPTENSSTSYMIESLAVAREIPMLQSSLQSQLVPNINFQH